MKLRKKDRARFEQAKSRGYLIVSDLQGRRVGDLTGAWGEYCAENRLLYMMLHPAGKRATLYLCTTWSGEASLDDVLALLRRSGAIVEFYEDMVTATVDRSQANDLARHIVQLCRGGGVCRG